MAEIRQYAKPPLVEAVLELRFETPFTDRELTRVKDKVARKSSKVDELKNYQAQMVPDGAVKDLGLVGYRVTAANGVDVVLVQNNSLVTSRMAPYEGWDRLIADTKTNYEAVEKIIGLRRITRIGARFINRVDVPNRLIRDKYIGDLLNIKIEGPPVTSGDRGPYSLALNFVHPQTGIKMFAQISVGDPVLIDHTPLFIDLDCAIDEGIPATIAQVWTLIDTMREPKDDVFESFITSEVRELFQ